VTIARRIARHLELTRRASERRPTATPPFLILFIDSTCNLACDHCFYWRELNGRDDLMREELFALSDSLDPIESLSLSGGEPFLRRDFAEICDRFVQKNGVKRIDCPTSGWFTERTVEQLTQLFKNEALDHFSIELSLDGMPPHHDWFRRGRGSFARALATYDALAELQRHEPRLQIDAVSTVTAENVEELRRLTTFLFERCPEMGRHHLALLRGERKRASLAAPDLASYRSLVDYSRRLWSSRSALLAGSVVDPMLHWAKEKTVAAGTQVVPCKAGVLSGVVYANGDVSVCENHPPIGNLRRASFPQIWNSEAARALRASIARKSCWCTNEVFLWPSVVFQPAQLTKAWLGSRAWRRDAPMAAAERVVVGDPNDRSRLPAEAIAWLDGARDGDPAAEARPAP
jgi:MoaA/NifB/PqqE/SkfB family radical SAM enzyme